MQVPVELVMAVMRRENAAGDTMAARREPDGSVSRGLMQVKEATARDLGLSDPMMLHVPAIGIDYGVHYLAQQLARYRGNVANAVAAYNAGSARFTVQETFVNQAYVTAVLGFYRQLRAHPGLTAASVGMLAAGGLGLLLFARQRARRAA